MVAARLFAEAIHARSQRARDLHPHKLRGVPGLAARERALSGTWRVRSPTWSFLITTLDAAFGRLVNKLSHFVFIVN